jgi:hypothetical protein
MAIEEFSEQQTDRVLLALFSKFNILIIYLYSSGPFSTL